jgi:beta-N-acetylhexosaminidase
MMVAVGLGAAVTAGCGARESPAPTDAHAAITASETATTIGRTADDADHDKAGKAVRRSPHTIVGRRALQRLVGQKLMVSFRGQRTPPPALLARVQRGEVGGVILFSDNVPADGVAGVKRTVARLQQAARRGHNPPLLIATDQEGGDIRRLPGPPVKTPQQMAAGSAEQVRASGLATGRSLRQMGVGLDLAPVADLPADTASFLGTRAFSADRARNVRSSVAFAEGLQQAGTAATAKHYPGLGSSGVRNTDTAAVTLTTARSTLDRERAAFVRHAKAGTRVVMVSNAIYVQYDARRPAVVSPTIIGRLRRDGFRGVIISDELRVPNLAAYGNGVAAAATRAGVDIALFANSDGAGAFRSLVAEIGAGRIRRAQVESQVRRIIALKRWIADSQLTSGGAR